VYREWDNHTLVFLSVKDEWALNRWVDRLRRRNIPFAQFQEPDLGGSLTAVACIDTGDVFKSLQLA
jgi:hypothetical protein